MESHKKVAYAWVVFYAIYMLTLYFFFDLFLFDFIAYLVILVALIFFSKKFPIPGISIHLFALSCIGHVVGMTPFMLNGEQVSLYHEIFFGGQYDLLTHVYGMIMLTLGSLTLYASKARSFNLLPLFIIFMALVGGGAVVEMAEFGGYSVFGFGWGAFQFGEGDNSSNFGPWGDSMTDLYANLLGISLGFILYGIYWRFGRPKLNKSS